MYESQDKKTIRETYNQAAATHGGTSHEDEGLSPDYEDLFACIECDTPPAARALDLGCGDARRFTQRLARHFHITGVDFSERQIEEARKLMRDATFVCQDMMAFEADSESFHCILCLYALFHIPLKEQRVLIHRMAEWLVLGGYLAVLYNNRDTGGVDVEEDWCGGPMRWFHYSRQDYEDMLAEAGFREILSFTEDDADPEAWRVALLRKTESE